MKGATMTKKLWAMGLLYALASLMPAWAEQVVTLREGHQQVFTQAQPVERAAVGNPEIADVAMISRTAALVTAKKAGITSLKFWARGESAPQEYVLEVLAPGAPDGREVLDSQVQTDIKIVEVSRRALQEAGINLMKNTANTTLTISPPGALAGVSGGSTGGFGSGAGFTLESASGFLPIAQAFNLVAGNANKGLLGVISVLEANGFAYTLAEPSLTAMSGQSATFLAGGEFPIPVEQRDGAVTVEYKEFGVRLTLTPTVLDRDRIMLKVAPEVSELDFTAAVQAAGVSVPALTVRRTETVIQLGDGESFVISGLISRNNMGNVDKVPLLGDLPILGAFFKSTRIDRTDKELVMVVTPHLVRAIAKDAPRPELPGRAYHEYQPTFGELLFQETGRFGGFAGAVTGFSN